MIEERDTEGALDPNVDAARWERVVGSVLAAAEPELARRESEASSPLTVLESWARPVFAVAASLALLASATVLTVGQRPSGQLAAAETGNTLAEALVPTEVAAWLEVGHALTADDLVTAIDEP